MKANKFLAVLLAVAFIAPWGEAYAQSTLGRRLGRPAAKARSNASLAIGHDFEDADEEEMIEPEDEGTFEYPPGWRERVEVTAGYYDGNKGKVNWHGLWERAAFGLLATKDNEHTLRVIVGHNEFSGNDDHVFSFTGNTNKIQLGHILNEWSALRGSQLATAFGYGFRKDRGKKVDGSYLKGQETDLLVFDIDYYLYRKGEEWILRWTMYGRIEWDFKDGLSDYSWDGDVPGNKTNGVIGGNVDLCDFWSGLVRPTLGIEYQYERESREDFGNAIAGLTFFRRSITAEVKYGTGLDSGTHDKKEWQIYVDFVQLVREGYRYFFKRAPEKSTAGRRLAPSK